MQLYIVKVAESFEVNKSKPNHKLENFASLETRVWKHEFARYYFTCIYSNSTQKFLRLENRNEEKLLENFIDVSETFPNSESFDQLP